MHSLTQNQAVRCIPQTKNKSSGEDRGSVMTRSKARAAAGVLIAVVALSAQQGPAALAASPAPPAPPAAGSGAQVRYQGRTVSYAQLDRALGTTYCDDHLGYGKLTCYGSDRQLEAALLAEGGYAGAPHEAARVAHELGVPVPAASRAAGQISAPVAASGRCHPYVVARLWARKNAHGSTVALYCNY